VERACRHATIDRLECVGTDRGARVRGFACGRV
jgi:hypothetical protein